MRAKIDTYDHDPADISNLFVSAMHNDPESIIDLLDRSDFTEQEKHNAIAALDLTTVLNTEQLSMLLFNASYFSVCLKYFVPTLEKLSTEDIITVLNGRYCSNISSTHTTLSEMTENETDSISDLHPILKKFNAKQLAEIFIKKTHCALEPKNNFFLETIEELPECEQQQFWLYALDKNRLNQLFRYKLPLDSITRLEPRSQLEIFKKAKEVNHNHNSTNKKVTDALFQRASILCKLETEINKLHILSQETILKLFRDANNAHFDEKPAKFGILKSKVTQMLNSDSVTSRRHHIREVAIGVLKLLTAFLFTLGILAIYLYGKNHGKDRNIFFSSKEEKKLYDIEDHIDSSQRIFDRTV